LLSGAGPALSADWRGYLTAAPGRDIRGHGRAQGGSRAHFPWWLFLYEALAILAFGVSWFVKGQTLIGALKDAPPVTEPAIQL